MVGKNSRIGRPRKDRL